MIGAIAGDIIGSVYEVRPTKRKDFEWFPPDATFTDDTVLTVAVADALLGGGDYAQTIKAYAKRYPMRGYGGGFLRWVRSPGYEPYNSFGNGSAMRVSPVACAFDSLDEVLHEARRTAECTHNHPEGIKGAEAVALAVFLARQGQDREAIRQAVQDRCGYDLSRTVDEIRPVYSPDVTCQGSVPQALIAFLASTSFEDAVRNAVSLGGDADTQACIAGALAEACYKTIPRSILAETRRRLADPLWCTTLEFYRRYGTPEMAEQLEAAET